jgi:hypothetical protein
MSFLRLQTQLILRQRKTGLTGPFKTAGEDESSPALLKSKIEILIRPLQRTFIACLVTYQTMVKSESVFYSEARS